MVLMTTTAAMSVEIETDDATALYRNEALERSLAESSAEADVLVQLKANLAQLEDMHGRMKYMMGELSYLLTRRS